MHVIATAGHVDHGKSALIRALTGMEPDRWSEERRRGMTIDLGFAWTTLDDGCTLAFVDVPGHERFVPNMLAGIGPVPAAMFVVAADEGWMAQSTEHLEALDALEVGHGVLVISRCDLADPRSATQQAQERIRASSLGDLPVVHTSAETGQGLAELRLSLDALAHRLPLPEQEADVRLWVDRAFTIHGAGTVVTGTLSSGRLRVGQELQLHPARRLVTVRGLQSLGISRTETTAVARVAVNLRGVALNEVGRGDALLTPQRWLTTGVVDVRLRGAVAEDLPRELMFHVGSSSVAARVRPLGAHAARLTLPSPLPLRTGDHALLRDPGTRRIPAGVVILDVRPPDLNRRGAARRRAAELVAMSDRPDGTAELARRRLIHADQLEAMGAAPPPEAAGGAGWLLDRSYRDELANRLGDVLTHHRQEHPLDDGMPVEAVRHALDLPDAALITTVLDSPAAQGISLRRGRVRDGEAPLPNPVRDAVNTIKRALRAHPFQAPTADELAALGVGEQELAAAERVGELLRLGPGLVLLPDAENEAVERLSELPSPFTLGQARTALDTTRRVAVPLLERLGRRSRAERLTDGTHRLR